MKKISLLSLYMVSTLALQSQKWVDMMQEPGKSFYEIQAEFNAYWKDKNIHEKGKGYKQFKRWEHYMEPRVYPSGNTSLPSTNMVNFAKFIETSATQKSALAASTTWTAVGPMGAMTGSATNGFPRKAGRDNFITFHPTNPNTIWAGTPAGGLWKTTDNGLTWSTNTDYLTVIGCSDLAIDPLNPNIMYLATGDGDASDTYCIGVLKSTDGGATWNPTGLTFNVNQFRLMRRLIIHPTNPQILLAATNSGIYRTSDAGVSWTIVSTGNMYDVEFKPGNPSIVYAAGTNFRLSTNGGLSFTTITNGIATTGSNRMRIAVTPADTNYVYVIASSSANNGLLGVYRSVNGGSVFINTATAPNLLGNACNGSGTGGQGWFDLAIAASPLDKNEVVVGGVNVWRSLDGGTNWSAIGCWIGTGTPPYIHADHHELEYNSAGVLYSANDGGFYDFTGNSWTDRTGSRNIAQIYKIGLSSLSPNLWITGHQDNGSNIYTGLTYKASMAGDGMDCFIDRTNNNNMFASYYNGQFRRSTNGGASWLNATTGMTGTGAWVSPWKQDPVVNTRIYAGRNEMWISNNLAVNWTQLTAIGGSGTIREFAIAPSNNQVIYVIKGNTLRKTSNGGASWSLINGTVPVTSAAPSFITVDPTDASKAWVTLSGYSNGNKVYQTTNGGLSWTNVSFNLPNLPANCSVYQPGTNDRIYIGMDVGVYYKDNSSNNWTLYNNGLPNVPIADLEISPAANTLLRAATYGRGVYEVDLIQAVSSPESNFSFNGMICEGDSKTFTDNSTESPTSWSWSVSPANGVSINSYTLQNPVITFSAGGTYVVSMIAANGYGQGTTASQTITVNSLPVLSVTADADTSCVGEPVTVMASGADTYTWLPGNHTTSSLSFTAGSNTSYTVSGSASGCTSKIIYNLFVSECTGLNEFHLGNRFSMYPNPANNKISLRYSGGFHKKVIIEVYDAAGKMLVNNPVRFSNVKQEYELDLEDFPAGVFLMKIQKEGIELQQIRFIKE